MQPGMYYLSWHCSKNKYNPNAINKYRIMKIMSLIEYILSWISSLILAVVLVVAFLLVVVGVLIIVFCLLIVVIVSVVVEICDLLYHGIRSSLKFWDAIQKS